MDMSDKKALMASVSLLLAVTLELTFATPVVEGSPERIVGVKVGHWVKYGDFLATWSSNDPDVKEPPAELVEHNNTEWVTNTVTKVTGTRITFQTVTHYKNHSETTSISYVDINTGEGNGTFMFVSANLTPGESIYDSSEQADTWINETIQLVYMNSLRKTNYLVATQTQFWPDEIIQNLAFKIEYFWDKTTGILSERMGTFVTTTGEYRTVAFRSEIMTDTNLWEENPDTTPPTAEAGPDQNASVNQTLSFDAGSSSDNEGGWGIASYDWDFDDGTRGTGITITHAFNAPRNYTVTLTVKDWGGNSDMDTLTVTVQETSSPPSIMGVVILVILFSAGLILWRLKTKK